MFDITLSNRVSALFPNLKRDLKIAHLKNTPSEFVYKGIKNAVLYAFLFTVLFFLILKKSDKPLILLAPIYILLVIALFFYSFLIINSKAKKRQHEIDQEVVFVGRYMLIKLYSGRPLLNALIETSKSKGVAARYIKEIVDDIETGSTIEDALNSAMVYSPSEKLGKILFHVNNSLKLGINVTRQLEIVLEEITREEDLEIKKYGKKLNTLVIFYMLMAVILPSLGAAIFIVISRFINLSVSLKDLMLLVFFIIMIELLFMSLFKGIRPTVNL